MTLHNRLFLVRKLISNKLAEAFDWLSWLSCRKKRVFVGFCAGSSPSEQKHETKKLVEFLNQPTSINYVWSNSTSQIMNKYDGCSGKLHVSFVSKYYRESNERLQNSTRTEIVPGKSTDFLDCQLYPNVSKSTKWKIHVINFQESGYQELKK